MACSRRSFIGASLAAAAALQARPRAEAQTTMAGQATPAKSVRIERIEAFPVVYPTKGRFKFFEDAKGNSTGRPSVVVKITAEDGTVGWGQSVPTPKWSYETLETSYWTILKHLAPAITGLNAFDEAAITTAMSTYVAGSFSTGQPICKAGIDLALFDLTGKILGRTAAERWGRKGLDRVLMSWTLNPKSLDDMPAMIDEGRAKGYRNFNVKVAPDLDFDVKMCRELKRLVPDGFLWADANGGYDLATARKALPALRDAGVAVLEQPIKINRITGYQELRAMKALPILLDEGVISHVELEEFVKLGMCDGLAMKPARVGGLSEARRQVEFVLERGLMFLGSGLTDPDLSLAASLLLYGAYGLKYPAALNGPQFLSELSILKQPLIPKDGYLPVPTGPGLGVEVDEDKLAAHSLRL